MLRRELAEICAPVLRTVLDHPFWTGLRDGTLPPWALARFVRQDTAFLLPAYARALARCAASAPDDADVRLLAQSVAGTLEARDGLRAAYTTLTGELGLPALDDSAPAEPAVTAHAAHFADSSAHSFHAGLGALLPMVWFNAEVSDHLRDHAAPDSRYLPWITAYHPGASYRHVVDAFLAMTDRAADQAPPRLRELITDHFARGVRHELAFADCCAAAPARPAGKNAR
ncbi:TenA family transcriptional regulator [Streptomyces sp. NPDC049577]|uniref:TenA family protein n=1 Tax=Streptomyces sp. NPDC049577 TaxID=3155153 RepID=UPI00341DE132